MSTFFSIFLGLLLLILAYFYLKSESAVRAKLRYLFLALLLLLLAIIVIGRWPHHPPKEKPRLSILPLSDYSYNDHFAWLTYHLTDDGNHRLEQMLAPHFRVLPQKWLWQCLDADSVMDVHYLQNFSRRIGLQYAVIGSITFEREETAIDYFLLQMPQGNLLRKGRVSAPPEQRLVLGAMLAQEIVGVLLPNAKFVSPTMSAQPAIVPKNLALKNLASRNYAYAIAYAAQGFAIDSTDVVIRNTYAEALLLESLRQRNLGRGNTEDRLRPMQLCEETLLKYHADNAEAYRLLAKYYLAEKIYGKAETLLLKALALQPDYADAYVDYTYLHPERFAKIKFKNEEQILRHVLSINPCHEEARLRLADYFYYRNLDVRSRAEIEALLAIHPRSIDGLMYLGKLAMEREDFPEFSRIYDQLLQIDGRNPEIFYNLGIYYYHQQDFEHAEQFFTRAVRLGNHLDSHLYLGYIYEKQGRLRQALSEYGLRVRGQRGPEDEFAEEARKRLRLLTKPDSTIFHANGN